MYKPRRPFQGVLNILSFNRHFYVIGLCGLVLLLVTARYFGAPAVLLYIITGAFLYGLIMPLMVSAYVYDFSGYYTLKWMDKILGDKQKIRSILNINAGFDETSFEISHKFPSAKVQAFDFYDKKRHTEPAIRRARKVSNFYPGTQVISSADIPLNDKSVDVVFLLSAVHEIRSHIEKIVFLKECRRVCKDDGNVVMVEHLRDFPSFVAFTVGFTHFFSRSTWRDAFFKAGFTSVAEQKFTPFMSVFNGKP